MFWLTGLESPWLLVIDNADDPTVDYSRFFPAGERGHILITSQNSDCKIHATIGYYEFGNMDEEDAVTLLLKAAQHNGMDKKEVRDIAKSIAKTLGYLALALIQAGASIRQGICSLEEYDEVFTSYKTQIMRDQFSQRIDSYQYTIYTTWEVSVQRIERLGSETAVVAIQILQTLAFLHFEQVPTRIFERAWNGSRRTKGVVVAKTLAAKIRDLFWLFARFAHARIFFSTIWNWRMRPRLPNILHQSGPSWNVYRFRQALALLARFSLISKNVESDSYSMHPMVHFWARERLSKCDQSTWSEIATMTLANSITPELEPSCHLYRRSLIPHIDACLQNDQNQLLPEHGESIASTSEKIKFAAIYSECGKWTKALVLQKLVLSVEQKMQGEAHPDTLAAMSALA